ncbi:MAG: hypothetical protein IJH39_03970, partial [Clostridia bacterium]|nr:hypothetical protein [Clostridia bacterium]
MKLETAEKWVDREVGPITKLKTHYTTTEMDGILYEINDILYFLKNLYVTPQSRVFLRDRITEAGKQLKQLSFTREDKKAERRDEIVERLRELYTKANATVHLPTVEYQEVVEKMNKYLTALYLKDKNEGNLTEKKRLDWIRRLKLFAE